MRLPSTAYDHTPILEEEPPPGWDADDLLGDEHPEWRKGIHEHPPVWQRVLGVLFILATLWFFWTWFRDLVWSIGHTVVDAIVNAQFS